MSTYWPVNVFLFAQALATVGVLAHAWLHQNDWYEAKRREDAHLAHFRDKVAGSWIFYDGRGW